MRIKATDTYLPHEIIDVWRVHEPGIPGGCVFDNEADAEEMKRGEMENGDPTFVLEITKGQMTRGEFDALSEFDGF